MKMSLISLFSNAKIWGLSAISFLISTLPLPAMGQAVEHQPTENADGAPYRLLIPLLQPLPPPVEATQLEIGDELPTLPIDLPIPQSGVLQWSLINHPQSFIMLFELPQSRSQAEAAYLEQLQASGWQAWTREQRHFESGVSGQAFILESYDYVSSDGADESPPRPLIFCKQGGNAKLFLQFSQAKLDTTKLTIDLEVGRPHSICAPQGPTLPERFPELVLPPPTNAQIDFIRGSHSDNASEREARIQTSLALNALADHYANQMQQQGWTLKTTHGDNLIHWSLWSRSDDPDSYQQATIHLFATENPNHYVGIFRAQNSRGSADSLATQPIAIQTGTLPKAVALQILRDRWQIPDSEPYELWLQQLPPSLAVELSIPPETTILGGTSGDNTSTAILETLLRPKIIQTFYRESLTATGWQIDERMDSSSGSAFEASDFRFPDVFCQPEEGLEIQLQISPRPDALTTFRLNLHPIREGSPCWSAPDSESPAKQDFWANAPVPHLQAPPETTVSLRSSSGSVGRSYSGEANYFSSEVCLQSRLTAEALANHYAEQLRWSGWTPHTAMQSDDSFMSLWRIETDTGIAWQGFLSLIAQPESGQWAGYFVAFTADFFTEETPLQ